MKKRMDYYKTPKGRASYKRKLKADSERSSTPERKRYRRLHKRLREKAIRDGKNVKGKDISKQSDGSYKLQPKSVNRSKKGEGNRKRGKRRKRGS